MTERVPTYVVGLDELIEGGIPKGQVILISGPPGTMKSSFAFSILFNNAKLHSSKGVYLSLEQSRKSLLSQMNSLGMDLAHIQSSIFVVDMGRLRMDLREMEKPEDNAQSGKPHDWVEILKAYIQNLKQNLPFDLLVIDSLPVLEIITKEDQVHRRDKLFYLMEWLRDLGVTTLIVSEVSPGSIGLCDEDFLADGVIKLGKEKVGTVSIQRRIVVDKLRETNHNTDSFALMFKDGRFQVSIS